MPKSKTSKVRPKSSRIRTDMDIREQQGQSKNVHILSYARTQREHVSTLL